MKSTEGFQVKWFVIVLTITSSLPLAAEDWVVNGKTLHDVQVGNVFADHVEITYTTDNGAVGVGGPQLKDLAPDLQKRFGYSPTDAKAAADAKAQAQAQAEQELRTRQARSQPLPASTTTATSVTTIRTTTITTTQSQPPPKPAPTPMDDATADSIRNQLASLQADIQSKQETMTHHGTSAHYQAYVADERAQVLALQARLRAAGR